MEPNFFHQEIKRLVKHFGPQNFSDEKNKLIWAEVRDLPDKDFKIIVDLAIGEFNVNYPPTVSKFRDFAIERRKVAFRLQEERAAKNYKTGENQRGDLDKYLSKVGAESLMDAILKRGRDVSK